MCAKISVPQYSCIICAMPVYVDTFVSPCLFFMYTTNRSRQCKLSFTNETRSLRAFPGMIDSHVFTRLKYMHFKAYLNYVVSVILPATIYTSLRGRELQRFTKGSLYMGKKLLIRNYHFTAVRRQCRREESNPYFSIKYYLKTIIRTS